MSKEEIDAIQGQIRDIQQQISADLSSSQIMKLADRCAELQEENKKLVELVNDAVKWFDNQDLGLKAQDLESKLKKVMG